MWFEVLPSVGVIFTAMSLGCLATFAVPKLILGRPSMRELIWTDQLFHYQRDRRLTGDPYKFQGLDAIPEPGQEVKSKK